MSTSPGRATSRPGAPGPASQARPERTPHEGSEPISQTGPGSAPPAGLSPTRPAGPGPTPPARPLRRDAACNRQRILEAATQVFTERGLEATLDDIAHAASVGVGTVYRRFPDKESLVEALFTERVDTLVRFAEEALAEPDPWAALVSFLEHAAAMLAGDRGFRQILMFATYGRDRVGHARARLQPVITKLVHRAQASGELRPDVQPTDMPLITFMLSTAAEYAQHVRPEVWRRYLTLMLDGLRLSRMSAAPLPERALAPEEIEQAMRTAPWRGR